MAEENEAPQGESVDTDDARVVPGGGKSGSMAWLVVMLVIVGISVGAGLGVGMTMRTAQATGEPVADDDEDEDDLPPAVAGEYAYYDLDPITVNPNTGRMERFIRVALTLKTHPKDLEAVTELIGKIKPDLTSRLIKYFANLTLDKMRETKNLNRICREVKDLVNQMLWPGRRPRITEVLLKEFTIS